MEQNRFFLWTARTNSILFLLLLVLSIGLVIFVILENNTWSRRNTVEVVGNDKDKEIENLRLSDIKKIPGRDIQYLELYSSRPSKGFSSGGYGRNKRNVVFFVGQEMKSHWLFDTNKYLISRIEPLHTKSDNCKDRKTVAIYYEVRKEDTDNNGDLDGNDSVTVSLTSPDGQNYVELESNITSVLDHSIDSKASILTLLVQDNSDIFLKKYSLSSKKKISEKEISRIGKKN